MRRRWPTSCWSTSPGPYPNQALTVPTDSPIKSPKQLAGKRIAVNTLGNINELEVKVFLQANGVDPGQAKLVEVGVPDMPAALASGNIDAAAMTEPFITLTLQDGSARILAKNPFAPFGRAPLVAGWLSTAGWLQDTPNTAVAFMSAIEKATQFVDAHPGHAAKVLPDYTKIPAAVAAKVTLPIYKAPVTPADVQPYIDEAQAFGMISAPLDASEVLAPSASGTGG